MSNKITIAAVLVLSMAVAFSLAAVTTPASDLPRPSYARTMLKVSRSLPGETEEVKVRTSEGSVATLIVKRREKSIPQAAASSPQAALASSPKNDSEPKAVSEPSSTTIGYQPVDIDPWSRLKTWSSVSDDSKSDAKKKLQEEEIKDEKNWVPVNRDSWKPVRPLDEPRSWLVADQEESSRSFPQDNEATSGQDRIIRYAYLQSDPPKRTNIGANRLKNIRDAKNVPAEVVIRSEVNVKSSPSSASQTKLQLTKRLPMSLDLDGTPIVHGRRVPDDPIDKIQVWRNARVINDQLVTDSTVPVSTLAASNGQSFDRFFEDVNRRYSKSPETDADKPKPYRNEILAAEIYESSEESYRPQIRKRMLQPEVTAIYPNSRLYSPPDNQPKVSLVHSLKPGTRAPVLQYAHPELGIQPAAKVVKTEKKEELASRYHQPSSPSSSNHYEYGEHRHKKKYVLNDKTIVDSYSKNTYPKHHYYGIKRPVVEPPFWVKFTEGVKSHISDSVTRVSELTKPVFDPLVEATRKISENLGLSRASGENHAQEKVGTVATGSSVLIPALGLMASGAALGIGAVAVGRYLDVDVLKRSMNENSNLTDEEKERAMGIIAQLEESQVQQRQRLQGNDNVYILVQDDEKDATGQTERRKRSIETPERLQQRKGADQIAEIVEIDVSSTKGIKNADAATVLVDNDLSPENEEAIAKAIAEQAIEAIVGSRKEEEQEQAQEQPTHRRRRRRSLSRYNGDELADALQNLENAEVLEVSQPGSGDWTSTPCAKRLFCDAMLNRSTDDHVFMEKKMAGLLRMIQPSAAAQVSAHFDEVMAAVRSHDCSTFSCPQARPASVFF